MPYFTIKENIDTNLLITRLDNENNYQIIFVSVFPIMKSIIMDK